MYNFVPSTDHTAQVRDTPAHFLFLGRVVEAKGIKMALETFGRLHEEGHNNIRMTVAGDGELLEHLRSEVNEASYSEAVSFEGFVQGEELENVRRRANIFLLPSKHGGFPFSFLECAERGMACIVTTNSAIPDAFEAGVEFEPVDPNDQADLYEQMKRMIIDPVHREQIATAGQEAVRSCCTIEGASDRLRSMYREINEKA
jgi:glycosyltransferase involved in cell wall biosynthesis